ncbi:MAG: hypothetical protein HYT12_02685 [Candidatus Liptonbacteria bacterium]|nr:hypothetical protein [Candidatus Liptonbacteria bacterium]
MRIAISRSVSSAEEMVRAALQHTPPDMNLDGTWMERNYWSKPLDLDGDNDRGVRLTIFVYPGILIKAECAVYSEGGKYQTGDIEIEHRASGKRWKFHCWLKNRNDKKFTVCEIE